MMISWVTDLLQDYAQDQLRFEQINPYANSISYKIMRGGVSRGGGDNWKKNYYHAKGQKIAGSSNVLVFDRYRIDRNLVKISRIVGEFSQEDNHIIKIQYFKKRTKVQKYLFTRFNRSAYFRRLNLIHKMISKKMRYITLK